MSGPTWRFLLDENMPRSAAVLLRDAGHLVERVGEVGLRSKDDREILAYAEAHGACIVTADLDFVSLVRLKSALAAGVIVIRVPTDLPVRVVNSVLLHAIDQLQGYELRGLLVTAEIGRVRIRRLSDPDSRG